MTDQPPKLRLSFLVVVTTVAAGALLAGLTFLPKARAPRVTWQFGPDSSAVEPFGKVHIWDKMTAEIDLPFAAYVYVVSFDHFNGTVTYFPSEFLGTDHFDASTERMNFLPAGTHAIPGAWDKKPIAWFVPSLRESLSLCVIASLRPLTDLEEILRRTKQVGNRAFPDRSMGYYMPRAGRDQRVGKRKMPHPVLAAALHQDGAGIVGPPMRPLSEDGDIFIHVSHVLPDQARLGTEAPGNPFSKQLDQALDKQQGDGDKTIAPDPGK